MRVALALYGQPRFFELTYEHFFSNIIEMFDADVFFHTWWDKDMVGSIYPCAAHAKARLSDEDMLVRADTKDELMDLYEPKAFMFDSYENALSNTNYQYLSQYASKRCVARYMKQKDIKYDLVIRSRFDLMCTQDIEFVYDDSLWVPSCCPYTDRVNDMFSISNYDVFDKITNTFINLPEFAKEGKGEMEWALMSQIQKESITVKTFNADYDSFDVLRSDTADQFR